MSMKWTAQGTIQSIQSRTTRNGKPFITFLLVDQYQTRMGPKENVFEISAFDNFNSYIEGQYLEVSGVVNSNQSQQSERWFCSLVAKQAHPVHVHTGPVNAAVSHSPVTAPAAPAPAAPNPAVADDDIPF